MKKGSKMSQGSKEKMRQAKIGKPSNARGRKTTPKQRERLRQNRIAYLTRLNPDYKYLPNPRDDRKWLRRERIKIYGGYHSNGEWQNLKAQYNWTCPSCKRVEPEIKLTRDHVIAISRGGSDNIENIQPLCVSCNSLKATSTIKY